MIVDRIALAIVIIGALTLGSIGIFRYDFIAHMLGGTATTAARVIYTIIGLSGIWCISLLFREREETHQRSHNNNG